MNEWIFFAHTLVVVGFVLLGLRLGKTALITLTALQGVLANIFVVKQIFLFGLTVTASDVFAIGCILSLNLLQEYFGKDSAKQAARITLLSLVFFTLMSQIHLLYNPAEGIDTTQSAFVTIFSPTLRIICASIFTFFLVQQFDIRFFPLLKGKLPVRIFISLIFSQLLDTILFTTLGLYGLVSSVFDIMLMSFLIKCVVISISSPFVAFSKRTV